MPVPFRFEDLRARFTAVRPWAETAVGEAVNRCAICMAYTLQITPSPGDASISDIPGVGPTFAKAGPIKAGPSPLSAALGGTPSAPYSSYFFIRAAELLPRVLRAFGQPDMEGITKDIWPTVVGKKGVLHLANCYQTEGDKTFPKSLFEPMSGGHWDLFDGVALIASNVLIKGNTHRGKMSLWLAR